MIRVGVVSDTHGDFRNVAAAKEALGPIDWLLHAGDHFQDARPVAELMQMDVACVRVVAGNCDHPVREPAQETLEIDGVRIYLTHGHHFGVKQGLDRLYYRAQEIGARAAVFGHTHMALNRAEGNVLLFNPGSLTAPRRMGDAASCGLLEIEQGVITGRILYLPG